MPAIHTETTFETAIVGHLVDKGWLLRQDRDYRAATALDQALVLEFVRESQPNEWERYLKQFGDGAEEHLINRLCRELELRGTLDVLRHGIKDHGISLQLAYFKPDSGLNPETLALYEINRLSVMQQVHFSASNDKSVDLVLFLNGLPIATIELKNHFTGQTVQEGTEQYRKSRDPREPLFQFKKRALVHFTLDPDDIYFTTKLQGAETRFFPFNKGHNGGAGNPLVPYGYRTSWFWTDILAKDSWMEIIGRYMHLEVEEKKVDGKLFKKEAMIFPRYHQIDAVRKLTTDARCRGPGKNYLVQHSAGSGKSNSIAWLAYRLSSLYNDNNQKVFDSVIIITDRTVLDKQLSDTIYQFEHKTGVVEWAEKRSSDLADAITQGTNIIITTLQKFPFALTHLAEVPNRNYAVIIDEAHSSQGGEASRKMTEALVGDEPLEEWERVEAQIEATAEDEEDIIREVIRKRGPQKNISIFAFTATPKPKTLEVFGTRDTEGRPVAFHNYSMRQAIEEGFILDVLKNYITYEAYYRFCKKIEDDPELNKHKASRAIGHFASLHPTNISQKTQIMVEHFKQNTMKRIGGKAKAMVVTGSRKHALRYYLAFKEYIREKGYHDIRALVAFSGTVIDDGYPDGVTESQLNKFGEKELPDKFDTSEYQVLLVADKYQYGFNQPLLHTMYVDKKLSGVRAVQTLSRLNRIHPGKEDTFVLDFANDRQIILDSFQPYYETTALSEPTDPNHLYDLKTKTAAAQVYHQTEVDGFASVFYKPEFSPLRDPGKLNAFIDPAVDRFSSLEEEKQDEFKNSLTVFVRMYSFMSQVMPFQDVDLEKLYTYGRFLLTKLPKADYTERLKLDNEVALEYYRLQKIAEGDIVLKVTGVEHLDPTTEAGIRQQKEERDKLSNIIHVLNERFGTDFTDADRLYFEQIEEALYENEDLKKRALNNPMENFKYAFDEVFIQALIDRMDSNQDIFEKIMENSEFKTEVARWLTKKVYERFNQANT
jgi:type I restriction enzyme R subunit